MDIQRAQRLLDEIEFGLHEKNGEVYDMQQLLRLLSNIERIKKNINTMTGVHPSRSECRVEDCEQCAQRDCPHRSSQHYSIFGCPTCESHGNYAYTNNDIAQLEGCWREIDYEMIHNV